LSTAEGKGDGSLDYRQQTLAAVLALVAVALLVTWAPVYSRDWGWHLATAERVLSEAQLPWVDVFSYTAGKVYEPVHLIFQLTLKGFVDLFGLVYGLCLYRAVMTVGIALALFWALRRRGLAPWAAFALGALVLVAGSSRLMVRPHMWTTLGLVLVFDTMLLVRAGRLRRPLRLLPLFLIWVNAHPGVVYGVLVMIGFVVAEGGWVVLRRPGAIPAERVRRMGGWTVACVLVTFVHPLGPGLYPYLFAHRGMQSALSVAELAPLLQSPFRPWLAKGLILWVGGAGLAIILRRRLDPTLALAALAFFGLALVVGRELPLALIVLAFALASPLAGANLQLRARARRFVFALVLIPIGGGVVRDCAGRYGLSLNNYPVKACDWILKNGAQGRLYNTNAIGGYVVYRLAPRSEGGPGLQVYSDGRMPMFYEALALERDFLAVEERYAPEIVIVDFQAPIGRAYRCELAAGFRRRYALVHVSMGAKVYLRRGGVNQGLVDRFGYTFLSYVGKFWPGRQLGQGARKLGPFVPPPRDPGAFRREVERARSEDPRLKYLP
jgi:hypothetical protein